jgi:hypothetical protein
MRVRGRFQEDFGVEKNFSPLAITRSHSGKVCGIREVERRCSETPEKKIGRIFVDFFVAHCKFELCVFDHYVVGVKNQVEMSAMKLVVRTGALLFGMATILAFGALSIPAQDPAKKDDVAKAPYRRVPSGFAKVGLTDEQKEKVYSIRSKYYTKIGALQKELDGIRAQELTECEGVLTDAQKKLLAQQREETKSRRAAAKAKDVVKPAESPKPADSAKPAGAAKKSA